MRLSPCLPTLDGDARGQSIEPLHKGVVKACLQAPVLYKLLTSIDILREKCWAIEELKRYIL